MNLMMKKISTMLNKKGKPMQVEHIEACENPITDVKEKLALLNKTYREIMHIMSRAARQVDSNSTFMMNLSAHITASTIFSVMKEKKMPEVQLLAHVMDAIEASLKEINQHYDETFGSKN